MRLQLSEAELDPYTVVREHQGSVQCVFYCYNTKTIFSGDCHGWLMQTDMTTYTVKHKTRLSNADDGIQHLALIPHLAAQQLGYQRIQAADYLTATQLASESNITSESNDFKENNQSSSQLLVIQGRLGSIKWYNIDHGQAPTQPPILEMHPGVLGNTFCRFAVASVCRGFGGSSGALQQDSRTSQQGDAADNQEQARATMGHAHDSCHAEHGMGVGEQQHVAQLHDPASSLTQQHAQDTTHHAPHSHIIATCPDAHDVYIQQVFRQGKDTAATSANEDTTWAPKDVSQSTGVYMSQTLATIPTLKERGMCVSMALLIPQRHVSRHEHPVDPSPGGGGGGG